MTGHLCCVTSHTRLPHNTSVPSQLTFIPHLNYLYLNGTDNMVASVEGILTHTHTHTLAPQRGSMGVLRTRHTVNIY